MPRLGRGSGILVQAGGPKVSQTLLDSASMSAQSAPGRRAVIPDSPMTLLVRRVSLACGLGVIVMCTLFRGVRVSVYECSG